MQKYPETRLFWTAARAGHGSESPSRDWTTNSDFRTHVDVMPTPSGPSWLPDPACRCRAAGRRPDGGASES